MSLLLICLEPYPDPLGVAGRAVFQLVFTGAGHLVVATAPTHARDPPRERRLRHHLRVWRWRPLNARTSRVCSFSAREFRIWPSDRRCSASLCPWLSWSLNLNILGHLRRM